MFDDKVLRGEIRITTIGGRRMPGLVVSSDSYNSSGYIVVTPITSKETNSQFRFRVDVDETHGFVDCDNVLRVSERYVGRSVAKVSRGFMNNVDDVLETLFDLGYVDDSKDNEIASLKSEVARLKREVEYGREGIMSRAAEVSRYKKLYEKAVDQIADMTLAADVAKRIAEKTAVVEVEEVSEQAEEEEQEPVASVEETESVEEEIFEEEPEPTKEPEPPKMTFPVWEPPVAKPKAPEPVKKVNVNEANIYELMEAGFGKSEAGRITRWVRKYGKFKNLDDLTKVDGVTGKSLRKIRDGLEV